MFKRAPVRAFSTLVERLLKLRVLDVAAARKIPRGLR
jgi:hypothetical protein